MKYKYYLYVSTYIHLYLQKKIGHIQIYFSSFIIKIYI